MNYMKIELPLISISEWMNFYNYYYYGFDCYQFYHSNFGKSESFANTLCNSTQFHFSGDNNDMIVIFKLLNIIYYG